MTSFAIRVQYTRSPTCLEAIHLLRSPPIKNVLDTQQLLCLCPISANAFGEVPVCLQLDRIRDGYPCTGDDTNLVLVQAARVAVVEHTHALVQQFPRVLFCEGVLFVVNSSAENGNRNIRAIARRDG